MSSLRKKRGQACVCLCSVWLITTTPCLISWIVHIPSLPSKKGELSQFMAGFKATLLSKQPHSFLLSFHLNRPKAASFQIKKKLHSKQRMNTGKAIFLQQDRLWLESCTFLTWLCKHNNISSIFGSFTWIRGKKSPGCWNNYIGSGAKDQLSSSK